MFWLAKFFLKKPGTTGKSIKDAIKYFHTINGRMPNSIEIIKIKNAFMEQMRGSNVIPFPKDRITDWWKPRPEKVKPKKAYFTHISHLLGFHDEVESQLPDHIHLAYDNLKITL